MSRSWADQLGAWLAGREVCLVLGRSGATVSAWSGSWHARLVEPAIHTLYPEPFTTVDRLAGQAAWSACLDAVVPPRWQAGARLVVVLDPGVAPCLLISAGNSSMSSADWIAYARYRMAEVLGGRLDEYLVQCAEGLGAHRLACAAPKALLEALAAARKRFGASTGPVEPLIGRSLRAPALQRASGPIVALSAQTAVAARLQAGRIEALGAPVPLKESGDRPIAAIEEALRAMPESSAGAVHVLDFRASGSSETAHTEVPADWRWHRLLQSPVALTLSRGAVRERESTA